MTITDDDKLQHAREQGQAQFERIKELVEALERAEKQEWQRDRHEDVEGEIIDREEIDQAIHDHPLCVEVRSGWYNPCARDADTKPAEFRILLCTGGPAVQLRGELSEHGEPESAHLEVQNWFMPWTEFWPDTSEAGDMRSADILLRYARCFWFGE